MSDQRHLVVSDCDKRHCYVNLPVISQSKPHTHTRACAPAHTHTQPEYVCCSEGVGSLGIETFNREGKLLQPVREGEEMT